MFAIFVLTFLKEGICSIITICHVTMYVCARFNKRQSAGNFYNIRLNWIILAFFINFFNSIYEKDVAIIGMEIEFQING